MKISWMLETGGFYSSGLAPFESTMTCPTGGGFFLLIPVAFQRY